MATRKIKLPHDVSKYIEKKFKIDYLLNVKKVKRVSGDLNYLVEVTKGMYMHTLLFSEDGKLLEKSKERISPELMLH